MERFYPIGVPGEPWTAENRAEWLAAQSVQRSYNDEVIAQLDTLDDRLIVSQYGALPIDAERYPLFAIEMQSGKPGLPWVLITGGVHGYETSGVQGALAFLHNHAADYFDLLNLLVAPCVSPWGYEVIQRWNPSAIDPNRSFVTDSPSKEAAELTQLLRSRGHGFLVHMDLHETTDTDESEFRPALAARDGAAPELTLIPDGFYTVGDSLNPQPGFQAEIISQVKRVTHIAQADKAGQIIGSDVTQMGVIEYPFVELGLCAGLTGARFTTTTEVYPDSPSATPEVCIDAQVAALRAGLDYALASR